MRMIIFDDGRRELAPMTDLRPAFDLRTGILTNRERIERVRSEELAGLWAPARLQPVLAETTDLPVNELPDDDVLLLINGRWAAGDAKLKLRAGEAAVDVDRDQVVAAALSRPDARTFLEAGELPDSCKTIPLSDPGLVTYPWDVVSGLERVLAIDFDLVRVVDAVVLREQTMLMGEHPVEIHQTARIAPNVVFDVENGPVVVAESAVIRPSVILSGPCYVGPGSVVVDQAHIKSNTVIGPVCKVGGEVGGTIFQGYSNKSHDGHLGDSWVREWVNIGAGTTNSNLLNTYGEIAMRVFPDGPRRRTGLTFLGAVIGDHAKFAINTRLMTGTVIGTGAMVASSAPAPTTLDRFAWLTDGGERRYRLDKFIDVARTMMGRRHVEPSEAYLNLLRGLHEDGAS